MLVCLLLLNGGEIFHTADGGYRLYHLSLFWRIFMQKHQAAEPSVICPKVEIVVQKNLSQVNGDMRHMRECRDAGQKLGSLGIDTMWFRTSVEEFHNNMLWARVLDCFNAHCQLNHCPATIYCSNLRIYFISFRHCTSCQSSYLHWQTALQTNH